MNPETVLTLDDAVDEVLGLLTGLDLTYDSSYDRYRAITRQLNRALRANALEQDWSYYSSTESLGTAVAGENSVRLRSSLRPRVINDDAVRLLSAGVPVVWAYFLPRDALHKYRGAEGLWCAATNTTLQFSRPFTTSEDGLEIEVPVMREPRMFRLPASGTAVDPAIREQPVDFPYPDVVVARAAYFYAMTDPVMQPRAQTLEQEYKGLMYQLIERDTQNTDSPFENDFILPIQSGLSARTYRHAHPLARP